MGLHDRSGPGNIYTGEWWPSVFPGLALTTTVFGFALLTDAVTRFADPRTQDVRTKPGLDLRTAQADRDPGVQTT